MKTENIIRALAGTLVLAGVILSRYAHPGGIWLAVFVRANLLQSAFSGFRPADKIISNHGAEKGAPS